jgi:hypothetical protein
MLTLPDHLSYLSSKEWWTTGEAAQVIGLSRNQIVNHLYSGDLEGYDASQRGTSKPYYLIYRTSVEKFLESRMIGAGGAATRRREGAGR